MSAFALRVTFIAVALLLCLAPFTLASANSLKLHVMSYNIKGLPGILTSSEFKSGRYAVIGKILAGWRKSRASAPAIVLLQEAFTTNTRQLIEASGYPHLAQGPRFKSFVGLDSGLYILSQHEIVSRAEKEFGSLNCNRLDCFANKGMQMARIAVPGLPMPLEVYNTHLQAGRDDPPARLVQVKMLLEFFKEHHVAGSPVIFGGDFNIRPLRNSAAYDLFVQETGFSHSGRYCLENGCSRSPDTGWQGIWENAVDHQFFSTRGPVQINPVSIERTLSEPVEGFRLSDHLAHEVIFELKVQPTSPPSKEAP